MIYKPRRKAPARIGVPLILGAAVAFVAVFIATFAALMRWA